MEMEAVSVATSAEGLDSGSNALFSVKEEPLDFDLMVKVDEDDIEHDLDVEKKVSIATTATSANTTTAATAAVPQIGSSNSAFQPYKQQSLTILTNLQRGNVKTQNKENGPESLTFHEKAAKASLTDNDITESTVNAKDPNGYTPLMWAGFHGRLAIVQKLIDKGAHLDSYGPDGETALMFAACNGHTEVLTYLISKGAEVDVEDDAGNTALMFASQGNHVECVVHLLKSGASMSKPNGIGDTPFEIAINKGHLAAQYAMEDFLKEEIEMSISSAFSTESSSSASESAPTSQSQQTTINSNLILGSNSNSSSSTSSNNSSSTVNNGNSNNSNSTSSSNGSIVVITNCNGIGSLVVGPLENGVSFSNGSSLASTNSQQK